MNQRRLLHAVLSGARRNSSLMQETSEETRRAKPHDRRVHMANERTFLAWMRTSIGIMAFGFVVERFALFMKQFSFLLGKEGETSPLHPHGYSSLLGLFLVAFGVVMGVLAFVRYKKVQKQIDTGVYVPSSALNLLLTITVLITGVFLLVYLIRSI